MMGRGRHTPDATVADLLRRPSPATALAYFPARTKIVAMRIAPWPNLGVYLKLQYQDGTEEVKFIPAR